MYSYLYGKMHAGYDNYNSVINSVFHVLTTVHDTQEEPSSCFIVYIITDSLGLSH